MQKKQPNTKCHFEDCQYAWNYTGNAKYATCPMCTRKTLAFNLKPKNKTVSHYCTCQHPHIEIKIDDKCREVKYCSKCWKPLP